MRALHKRINVAQNRIEGQNMKALTLCVALVSLLGIAVGREKQQHFILAEHDTGNDFYFNCPSSYKQWVETGVSPTNQVWCIAYIEGFSSGYDYSELLSTGVAGPSSPMTNAQIYDIVARYIIQHPEKRSQNLRILIFDALKPNFHWKP